MPNAYWPKANAAVYIPPKNNVHIRLKRKAFFISHASLILGQRQSRYLILFGCASVHYDFFMQSSIFLVQFLYRFIYFLFSSFSTHLHFSPLLLFHSIYFSIHKTHFQSVFFFLLPSSSFFLSLSFIVFLHHSTTFFLLIIITVWTIDDNSSIHSFYIWFVAAAVVVVVSGEKTSKKSVLLSAALFLNSPLFIFIFSYFVYFVFLFSILRFEILPATFATPQVIYSTFWYWLLLVLLSVTIVILLLLVVIV